MADFRTEGLLLFNVMAIERWCRNPDVATVRSDRLIKITA
jgi:hypothetical protein